MNSLIKLILIHLLLHHCHGGVVGVGVINEALSKQLRNGGVADVMVDFVGGNSEALKCVAGKSFPNSNAKAKTLVKGLNRLVKKVQGPIKDFLRGQGLEVESFFTGNQMIIRGANLDQILAVANYPQVRRILKVPKFSESPPGEKYQPGYYNKTGSTHPKRAKRAAGVKAAPEWNIDRVRAPTNWQNYNGAIKGKDVVVGTIASGVRESHLALNGRWRSDPGWLDVIGQTQTPTDVTASGRGTGLMGIIAGSEDSGVGVAPKAQWIVCRGCDANGSAGERDDDKSCDMGNILRCGDFMTSPTDPNGGDANSDLRPDVVVASFYGDLYEYTTKRYPEDFFQGVVEAWNESGIMSAFNVGDTGRSRCNTLTAPGLNQDAFAVGATDFSDFLTLESSKGADGRDPVKPDIVAPGHELRSCSNAGDDEYGTYSSAAYAAAHVGGAMVLMQQQYRDKQNDVTVRLDPKTAMDFIRTTARNQGKAGETIKLQVFRPEYFCRGPNGYEFPTNNFGYGMLDVAAAVREVFTET